MEIIEKLQANFQSILDLSTTEYTVFILPKQTNQISKKIDFSYYRDYLLAQGCLFLGTDTETILSKSQFGKVVINRCLLFNYFREKELYQKNISELSNYLNMHHSTVSYYKRKHTNLIDKDYRYKDTYDNLTIFLDNKEF